MTRSAKTIWLFGIYLMIEGVFLMLAPSGLLRSIGIPDANSLWVKVLGFVVAVLGYYYVRNAKANLTAFFHFTVQVRILQFLFFLWLYFFERGTLALIGFSFVEFAAGIWTWKVLKES